MTRAPRRLVGDRALHRAAGEGVIQDRAADAAGVHVLDVLPADLFVGSSAFALAGEADAGEALAGGEDDAAVLVVVGVAFVLLHHGELHAVDGDQFIEGKIEGLVHQHIDLHQGLAAGVVGPEGAIPLPGGDGIGEDPIGR
jgi:hypothetical protein